MAYITKQDLIDAIGEAKLMQLTDDDRDGAINDVVVGKAISFATGTFEPYARARYTLPVPTTEFVKALNIDLALNYLDKRRAKTSEALKMAQDTYKEIERRLKDVSSGTAALDVAAADETVEKPASADDVLSGSSNEVFSRDKMSGF